MDRERAEPAGVARAIEEAKSGSTEVLGHLLELCRAYLLGIAGRELESSLLPKAGASDLVQETFLEAQRIFLRFEGTNERELLAWLRGILLNKASELHRHYQGSAKRRLGREVRIDSGGPEADSSPGISPADDAPSPSTLIHRDEEAERVRRAMDRIPEQYRQVLIWREWDEVPFKEIGERLGKTPDAARMLFWRAVQSLQEELERSSAHDSTS
ncbi:MAG: sigma-70 family RNA polymerase sigma factor [Isosphaeraceae bacterium]|nr:sigma-70 family RNA polymerase sigma factor [Isosphaeraceae bacterium]